MTIMLPFTLHISVVVTKLLLLHHLNVQMQYILAKRFLSVCEF